MNARAHQPISGRFHPVHEAAARLSITPEALRARCRRAMRFEGGVTSASLGGGIVAVLLGRTWRVRFPDA